MTVQQFLERRKDKKNYATEQDYIDDNKIKMIAYWGKNGKFYQKKLNKQLTKHQLELEIDQVLIKDFCLWVY